MPDNETRSLANKIMEVCEKSPEERVQIGTKARVFVSGEKNEIAQTRKMLSFIENALVNNRGLRNLLSPLLFWEQLLDCYNINT